MKSVLVVKNWIVVNILGFDVGRMYLGLASIFYSKYANLLEPFEIKGYT
jgi:hypothetical protein